MGYTVFSLSLLFPAYLTLGSSSEVLIYMHEIVP